MGLGLSQEADTQQIPRSPTPAPRTHENHQTAKTTSTRLNRLPHDCEAILKDADIVIDKSSIDQLYAGVFLNQKRMVCHVCISIFIVFLYLEVLPM